MPAGKKTVIIVPASIRSHLLPSFYLASYFREYDVYYLATDASLEKLVTDQGYHFIHLKTYGIGFYPEYNYVKRHYKRSGRLVKYLVMVKLFLLNELFRKRKREIDRIVGELSPDMVLIDIFNSPNFIFFYPQLRNRILFFSPMLSTHTTAGFPRVCEPDWNKSKPVPVPAARKSFSERMDGWQIQRCCRKAGIPARHGLSSENAFTTYYFKNIPELVLAPLELELSPCVRKPHQHYLGLCTSNKRRETNADQTFDLSFYRECKKKGKKILYCSFGTFFHAYEQQRAVARFVTNLIEACYELDDTEIIIAMNKTVLQVVSDTVPLPGHIHLHALVPQLAVLELTDLFITHGGLGSVKEAIEYEVPMLVYPVDFRWDQPGNALKVEYHGLGIKGDLRKETSEALAEKIGFMLTCDDFSKRVNAFRSSIRSSAFFPVSAESISA